MKKKLMFSGILVCLLVFSLALASCPSPSGGGGGEAYLTIIGGATLSSASSVIGVFPPGTTMSQATAQTGLVAGIDSNQASASDFEISGSDLKIKLYSSGTTRWYGSGTYDVIAKVNDTDIYRAPNVEFSGGAGTCPLGTAGVTW
jgi:hypothetical protein